MPIPLRELAVMMMLVPAALGLGSACQRAFVEWDAVHIGQSRNRQHVWLREKPVERSACTEESMLVGWDVQLQMQATQREQSATPQDEKSSYEQASL